MSNPTPGKRPPWVNDQLFPFESHFCEIDGNSVHFIDEGSGPTLLLLHGNPTWSFLYRDLIHALREHFRCVAVDHPGFGLSEARPGYGFTAAEHRDVLETFVVKLDLTDVTLMVQDWGGPIGLGAAARDPDRYSGLIIGNTWGWSAKGDKATERFSGFLGGPVGRFLIERFNFFVNVIIPKGHTRRKLTQAEMAMYRGPFPTPESRRPTHIFPKQIIDATPFLTDVEAGLNRLGHCHTLIVWGDKDIAFKADALHRWQTIFPEARTAMLPGAGHYIQDDAGHDIAAEILKEFTT